MVKVQRLFAKTNLRIPVCRTEYKDDPSAVWEQPHTVDTYLELDGRKSHNIVV